MSRTETSSERFHFRPHERLRKGADFKAVFGQGRRFRGQMVTVVAAHNGRTHSRLGVVASRRVGGAVRRNRAKRLMREAFRLNKHLVPANVDIIMIASPRLADDVVFADLAPEVKDIFRRIGETFVSG